MRRALVGGVGIPVVDVSFPFGPSRPVRLFFSVSRAELGKPMQVWVKPPRPLPQPAFGPQPPEAPLPGPLLERLRALALASVAPGSEAVASLAESTYPLVCECFAHISDWSAAVLGLEALC